MPETEARTHVPGWVGRLPTGPVLAQQASNGAYGRGGSRPATQEARQAIFSEAVEILANEWAQPLRVDDVARRVATSPRQLQRVFADVAGLGFRSYLRRLRMAKAADLLATTALPVKEIARRVGYGDPSQFSKAFKRIYGVSPSESRAMRRGRREKSGRVAPSPDQLSGHPPGTRFETRR
jgi:AraC family transcriptional regulator, regulatory protein of adaptative response / methylphosphotriester-DNA alkyltransferase methyltransferase